MTGAATHFVAPMTFQVLSGHPVASDLWGERQSEALDHIEYARWANLVVVAPATANTLAKAAHGLADNIVTCLLLAHPGTVLFAPAMNDNMWRHPATQANLEVLSVEDLPPTVSITSPQAAATLSDTVLFSADATDEDSLAGQLAATNEILRTFVTRASDVTSGAAMRRAELAVKYLEDARLKSLEIAMLLGYSSLSSFTTAFKSWYDMPPAAYRQKFIASS